MATIVTAETTYNAAQAGGYRLVYFRFTLDDGAVHDVGPQHPALDADVIALRDAKGAELVDKLAMREINEALNGD